MNVIEMGIWKGKKPYSYFLEKIQSRKPKTKKCEVVDFVKYRSQYTEEQIWARSFMWWANAIHKQKQKRIARERSNNNFRNTPRRPRF